MIFTLTILVLLLIAFTIKQYNLSQPHLELFSTISGSASGCTSCTFEDNKLPPLSTKGMLLPYPRYEWSYRPEEWSCKTKAVQYDAFNGVENNMQNHTYNPLGLKAKHALYGIMPESQLYYVKNRMGGGNTNVPIYSQMPIGLPTLKQ